MKKVKVTALYVRLMTCLLLHRNFGKLTVYFVHAKKQLPSSNCMQLSVMATTCMFPRTSVAVIPI